MRCTNSRFAVGLGLLASLVGVFCLSVGPAAAADATLPDPYAVASKKAAPKDEQKLLVVYPLRHVDGQTVLTTVPQVFPDATVTLDSRTNRVLVHASRSGHAVVEELIKALDVPPEAGEKKEEQNTLEVYSLKYADGQTVVMMAAEVVPDAMMTLDSDSKRLIAYASASEHKRLKEFIQQIDIAPESGGGDQIKVFQLVHTEAAWIAQAVSEIIDTEGVKMAVDSRTNSILAAGPERTLEGVEALLMRLDQESPGRKSEEAFRVRIVWFAEGSPGNDTAKLDKDLQAVQAELSRIGIGPIRSVGQVMVNTTSGGEFQIGCSAKLGDDLADLKISGALDIMEQKTPLLRIEINAMAEHKAGDGVARGSAIVRLVELSTEIAAPLGHCVVLGVTPVQEKTLAFAVQVQSDDG